MRLTVTDDGFLIQPMYGDSSAPIVDKIPAARELVSLRNVPVQKFEELGKQILDWSLKQVPSCRFDVTYVDKTTQKPTYRAAEKAMDRYFYKRELDG